MSQMAVLLDTTFVIDHLRGQRDAVERLRGLVEAGDPLYVNEVVVSEAWAGARDPEDRALTALLRFLEFVQPGPDIARLAGRWRADARVRGHTLAATDALIAAAAVSLDVAVLTRNVRDFALTPARVETY
jgi:predicted nucleic acid-binding protein